MGNRANIVLVDHDGWQLRYAHWAGCRMLDALLAGPEMAVRYIRDQQTSDFWTDELWADGGLLLDLTEHRLLFFGEELMATMNERRAMFEVLVLLWPGYTISWAYGATAEIAAYVGAQASLRDMPSEPELTLAEDTGRLHHLVTVIDRIGRVRAWPLWWGSSAAWLGPDLLDSLPGPGEPALQLGVIPESGVYVNVPNKTLGVWMTRPVPGLVAMVATTVAWVADRVLGGPFRRTPANGVAGRSPLPWSISTPASPRRSHGFGKGSFRAMRTVRQAGSRIWPNCWRTLICRLRRSVRRRWWAEGHGRRRRSGNDSSTPVLRCAPRSGRHDAVTRLRRLDPSCAPSGISRFGYRGGARRL
ncbi:hypothetical protein [Mycolicibacterium sp. PDY-3]|uniref:hypothetical protein n=1 Tax=Mycolicibacterium sp. PDY-3 TaxID=3376069 RepID=UPI00379F20DD